MLNFWMEMTKQPWMAAWLFSFRNSKRLLGHFQSEIQHGCLVIYAFWTLKKSSVYIYCSLPWWINPLPSGWCMYKRCSSVRQD
jgi:hypothetical protein